MFKNNWRSNIEHIYFDMANKNFLRRYIQSYREIKPTLNICSV